MKKCFLCSMSGYRILILSIVSVLLALAGYGLYVFFSHRTQEAKKTPAPYVFPQGSSVQQGADGRLPGGLINFSRAGHLARDKPGMTTGVWYLAFEAPGSPSLVAELIFDNDSICRVNTAIRNCGAVSAVNGAAAYIEGISQADGLVLVRQMDVDP